MSSRHGGRQVRRELEEDGGPIEDDDVLCRCGQAFFPSIWRSGRLVVGDFGDQEG